MPVDRQELFAQMQRAQANVVLHEEQVTLLRSEATDPDELAQAEAACQDAIRAYQTLRNAYEQPVHS